MYVQKCIKGVNGIDFDRAVEMMQNEGLTCNWWRERARTRRSGIGLQEIGERLTHSNLYLHVNAYGARHPDYAGFVFQETPFISLSAGNVTAPVFSRTSTVWSAHQTALDFATGHGSYEGDCFLFHCWVIVGLRSAVGVRALAEEVRDLKNYSQYSYYQGEGEIAAKIDVPPSQIEKFEYWQTRGTGLNQDQDFAGEWPNPDHIDPATVVMASHLAAIGRAHAAALHANRRNEHLWRSAAAPVNIVDLEQTALFGLVAGPESGRSRQVLGRVADLVADDEFAQVTSLAAERTAEVMPSMTGRATEILRGLDREQGSDFGDNQAFRDDTDDSDDQ